VLQQGELDGMTLYTDESATIGGRLQPRFRNRLHDHFEAATFRPVEWVDLDGEGVLRVTANEPSDLERIPLVRYGATKRADRV